MKKYIEITLLPDVDISLNFLWEKLYQQLHLAFVESKNDDNKVDVGVSFPMYNQEKRRLGAKLRIFAMSSAELEALKLQNFLNRLQDYVHIRQIKEVPNNVESYAFFSRLNEKSRDETLARRRSKKLNVPYKEALQFFQDKSSRELPKRQAHLYPFISVKSLSSGHKYPVTIVKSEAEHGFVQGKGFNTYGLSSDTSVPIF